MRDRAIEEIMEIRTIDRFDCSLSMASHWDVRAKALSLRARLTKLLVDSQIIAIHTNLPVEEWFCSFPHNLYNDFGLLHLQLLILSIV